MNNTDIFLAGAGYRVPRRRKSRKVKNLKDLKNDEVRSALSSVGGHRRKAAKRLGISLRTLYYWLQKLQ